MSAPYMLYQKARQEVVVGGKTSERKRALSPALRGADDSM